MGLIIIPTITLCVLISVGIIFLAVAYAIKRKKNPWVWGASIAFVIYNIVFWDWIPTMVLHKYYCSTQAGFWVYKTVNEWRIENVENINKLGSTNNEKYDFPTYEGDVSKFSGTEFVNHNIRYNFKHNGPLFIHRWRIEAELVDINSNEVLAKYVDFSTSQEKRQAGWSGWKFWLNTSGCDCMSHRDNGSINEMIQELGGGK